MILLNTVVEDAEQMERLAAEVIPGVRVIVIESALGGGAAAVGERGR